MSENARFIFDGKMYHYHLDSDHQILPDLITVRTKEEKLKKSEGSPMASVIACYLLNVTTEKPNLNWIDDWDSEF